MSFKYIGGYSLLMLFTGFSLAMRQALSTTMQTMMTNSSNASPANCVSHSVPTYQATTGCWLFSK